MPSRILMIDADPDMVTLGKLILEREEKFEVLSTQSGRAGLNILEREENIDLILIDVAIIGLTAWEVVKAIRNRADHAHLPIIMLMGRSYPASSKASTFFYDGQFDGCVFKPFVVADLIGKIDKAIQRKRIVNRIHTHQTRLKTPA